MSTVRDRFWAWGHNAGSHNGLFNLPGPSRMTPVEGAFYLGVPNLIMVAFGGQPAPPFDAQAIVMRPLSRVVWSIIGDSSSSRHNVRTDLEEVVDLAGRFPNVVGGIMDDFFHPPDAAGRFSRRGPEELAGFRTALHHTNYHGGPHPLDLWVVVYTHELDWPVGAHLAQCDVVTLWTWKAKDLPALEANLAKLERLAPRQKRVLGCYMWDFGDNKPMPVDAMRRQCEQGLKWLHEGRIEGMIFLATCISDLEIEAVEWTRGWIAEVGGERLMRGTPPLHRPALDRH
ncbi:MAG: hypothetical protein NTW19_21320 [Planctomycetota bacterium]|nr:hypothetical protein [Planctomycetota bacterium]